MKENKKRTKSKITKNIDADDGMDSDISNAELLPTVHKITGKFSTEKLMMMLDKEKLEALDEEFQDHPYGIELRNFVWLMKCALLYRPEEKYDLVHGLCKLFAEIDINGDKHMEWTEFTQYIIDAVMQGTGAGTGAGRDDIQDKKELVAKAHAQKFIRFYPSKILDRFLHEGTIIHAQYVAAIDQILVVENISKVVKLYTPDMKKKRIISMPFPKDKQAFVMGTAFNSRQQIIGCTCSDRIVYFFEYFTGSDNKYKLIKKSKEQDFVHYMIWYSDLLHRWLTAYKTKGGKHPFCVWDYGTHSIPPSPSNDYKILEQQFIHTARIMDTITLKFPLALCTASLDNHLMLWDLAEYKLLGELKGNHNKGIRSLDYIPDYGGNLVSVGHENYINIWSPEGSLMRAHVGKLEGHNAPVVSCKFVQNSPYCSSIDDKLNIRVWDIRNLSTIQIISQDKSKFQVSGMMTFGTEKRFAMYGRRMIFFDTKVEDKANDPSAKAATEDEFAFNVWFNEYYLQFIVVTKTDIRVYDARNGELLKVFSDVLDDRGSSDLTSFCLDDRHRKCFVGDTSGSIRVYNVSNGLFIKKVGEIESLDAQGVKRVYKDHSGEISHVRFVSEDKLLISTSWDSSMNVYDEYEPEESVKLRCLSGAHAGSAIMSFAFSAHLSLVATGSSNGIIAVWDYEMSRVEGMCLGHTREITCLQFLDPYSVLLSTAQDGTMYLWGVRNSPIKHRYSCFARLVNIRHLPGTEGLYYIGTIPYFICYTFRGEALHRRKTGSLMAMDSEELRELYNYVLEEEEAKMEPTKASPAKNKSFRDFSQSGSYQKSSRSAFDIGSADRYAPTKDEREIMHRAYVITGDEKGIIRLWDFTTLLEYHKFTPSPSFRETKFSFNARRKEDINVDIVARSHVRNFQGKLPEITPCERYMLIREWEGHKDNIVHMSLIENPRCFVSTSYDRRVKIWSMNGELYGCISLATERRVLAKKWNFPFDWEKKRKEEKDQILKVLDYVEETGEGPGSHRQDIIVFEEDDGREQQPSLRKGKGQLKEQTTNKKEYRDPLEDYEREDKVEDIFELMPQLNDKVAESDDIRNIIRRMDDPSYHPATPYSFMMTRLADECHKQRSIEQKTKMEKQVKLISKKMKINMKEQNLVPKNWVNKFHKREDKVLSNNPSKQLMQMKRTATAGNLGLTPVPKTRGGIKTASAASPKISSEMLSPPAAFSMPTVGRNSKKGVLSTGGLMGRSPMQKSLSRQHMLQYHTSSQSQPFSRASSSHSSLMRPAATAETGRRMVIGFGNNNRYLLNMNATDYKLRPTSVLVDQIDMKHKRGEAARIIGTSAFALNLKSQSNIQNYTLADNKTLTQNKKMLSTYTEFKQDWIQDSRQPLSSNQSKRKLDPLK